MRCRPTVRSCIRRSRASCSFRWRRSRCRTGRSCCPTKSPSRSASSTAASRAWPATCRCSTTCTWATTSSCSARPSAPASCIRPNTAISRRCAESSTGTNCRVCAKPSAEPTPAVRISMLLRLRLENFVLVDSAELAFGNGFTVLSGETGAGKSILLDALMLALGGRADPGVVREGQARADIVAEFAIDDALDAWLEARALQGDTGVVLLRRVIDADGRSRAFVNGHPATAALPREIGEQPGEIHGQHASQSLLRTDGQRRLLDGFGGLEARVAAVGDAYDEWRAALRALDAAEHGARELALERERLEWQLGELETLQPGADEWETLE